jgi:hypothetical protein
MAPATRAALFVCLVATIPYLPTIDDYFIQDDFGVVSLLSGKPASSFFGWFASTWMDDIWGYTPDEIRPFPAVTYQVAAWWGAVSPVANHVFNIAFHAANAVLVLGVGVAAAGLSLPAATFAAIVFALLPAHSETVAWVTGRVDSMPALFYTGAFLAFVRWRSFGRQRLYALSVALFFVALFSKQNTVTLGPALVMYDILLLRRLPRVTRESLRPYVPFVVLTVGFLLLRYELFGEIARESQLTIAGLQYFPQVVIRHLVRIVAGRLVPIGTIGIPLLVALLTLCVVMVRSDADRSRTIRAALFFIVIWTGLGIAPALVAGYESPRHVYLASIGWAIGLGLAADILWHARPRRAMRVATAVLAVLVVGVYGVQLDAVVREWNVRALVSQKAVMDLEREALAAPEGSLVIVGVPRRSWEWALPFAARPPFTTLDVTRRVGVVSQVALHCCHVRWDEDTRRTLKGWHDQREPGPVIALSWDASTGVMSRLTDREDAYLRAVVVAAMATEGPEALETVITGAIDAVATAR